MAGRCATLRIGGTYCVLIHDCYAFHDLPTVPLRWRPRHPGTDRAAQQVIVHSHAEHQFVELDPGSLVYPDWRHTILDEDEFAPHQEHPGYPVHGDIGRPPERERHT